MAVIALNSVLRDVLHILAFTCNLISIRQLISDETLSFLKMLFVVSYKISSQSSRLKQVKREVRYAI